MQSHTYFQYYRTKYSELLILLTHSLYQNDLFINSKTLGEVINNYFYSIYLSKNVFFYLYKQKCKECKICFELEKKRGTKRKRADIVEEVDIREEYIKEDFVFNKNIIFR